MLPWPEFARLVSSDDVLQSSSYHKVFLFQPELFALEEIVIRIKNSRDIFRQITINHSLYIVTVVNWKSMQQRYVRKLSSRVSRGNLSVRYLQNFKLNSIGDFADHSLNVLTTLFL